MPDGYEITPVQRADDRGVFLEWYRFDELERVVGHRLDLRQANMSVSKRGVVRGVHFADVPRGQAKYVKAVSGAVLDFVIDIRVGSPTFGQWDSVRLDIETLKAVYISEGLGHCFVALTDDAAVTYLVSDVYNPGAEHGITPLDTPSSGSCSPRRPARRSSPRRTSRPRRSPRRRPPGSSPPGRTCAPSTTRRR